MICEFDHNIFQLQNAHFTREALAVFRFQYQNNRVYRQFVDTLHTDINTIRLVEQIPFLPIGFFKSHRIQCGEFTPEASFESSGTTQSVNSIHRVKDIALYRESFTRAFEMFYGPVQEWCIVGLLPSYLERQHSSLVFMVDELIRNSQHPGSGFYLYEHEKLAERLIESEKTGQKTLLIGVSFALLDFAASFPMPLHHTVIMETGGMKGRRAEITRPELHDILKEAFGLKAIHSEYGMTELLSQAYSKGDGIFQCPPWMEVLMRAEDDPLSVRSGPATGIINIVDLANIHSCSFIATEDAGRLYADGSFEVQGRVDNSDIRGCGLMVAMS